MTQSTRLDTLNDVLVSALATIARVNVNDALSDTLEGDAIAEAVAWPMPYDLFEGMSMPRLCVFRVKESPDDVTMHWSMFRVRVRWEYVIGPVPMSKLGATWPVLAAVWRALFDTWQQDATMVDGSGDVLSTAGVNRIDEDSAEVSYDIASNGEDALLMFDAEVDVVWDPDALDRANVSLADFRSLLARYNLVGEATPVDNPLVESMLIAEPPEEDNDDE